MRQLQEEKPSLGNWCIYVEKTTRGNVYETVVVL